MTSEIPDEGHGRRAALGLDSQPVSLDVRHLGRQVSGGSIQTGSPGSSVALALARAR